MSVAGWCFIDHNTRQDAAARKLVRATATQSHRRREGVRSTQEHAPNCIEGGIQGSQGYPIDEENDKGEMRGGEDATQSRDLDRHANTQGSHSCVNLTAHVVPCPSSRMLEPTDFDHFTIDVPGVTYHPEYGVLLHQCKFRILHVSLNLAPLQRPAIAMHARTPAAGATTVMAWSRIGESGDIGSCHSFVHRRLKPALLDAHSPIPENVGLAVFPVLLNHMLPIA